MRQLSIAAVSALFVLVACGDNHDHAADAHPHFDAPQGSADARVDAMPGAPDANVDASVPDANLGPDAALTASQLIANAIGTADGTGLTLPIVDATVTYLKPPIGNLTNDPAGFTIQASQPGPAMFVSVDPATLTPAAQVGDVVSFTITTMGTVGGEHRAQAISGYTRTATGTNVNPLVKDVSAATDVVTALDTYDSELIDVTGTINDPFTSSGSGFQKSAITTAGITGDPTFQLRAPTTLVDAMDIAPGCGFTLDNTPVGRFNATAELAAYTAADINLTGCPAPTVVSAVALSMMTVRVTFTRNILNSSVNANGSQFTFDNGLVAISATVSGRTVTVTTSPQVGGTTYTATVAATVTDLQGSGIGTPNSAMFDAFVTPAVVRINELNANVTSPSTCDQIELRVVSGGSMNGYKIQERGGASGELTMTFGNLNVLKNDIIVVHENSASTACNPNAATQELTAIAQQPAATFSGNYDTAYDFWAADTGITNTDNVITLYDATATIMDAVFVSDDPAGTSTASATEGQAAMVGVANQWSPAMATYIDAVFRMNAVDDLNATGTDVTGTTIQRLDNTDDNDVGDWTTGAGVAQSWGLANPGQTPF